MEYHLVVRHPFFVFFRKHHCPACGELMQRHKMKRTMTGGTLEAKQLCEDHHVFPEGGKDILIMWYVFECRHCDLQYSVNKLFEMEKRRKKEEKAAVHAGEQGHDGRGSKQ